MSVGGRSTGNSWGWEFLLQPLAAYSSGADLAAGVNIPLPWMSPTLNVGFGATGALVPYIFGGPKKQRSV